MAASTRQFTPKNVRAMVTRLESAAGRIEKEFERQLKALDRARDAMQKEAKRQLDGLRREQKGFLTRVRQASRPSPGARKSKKSSTRATKRSSARRTPARRTTRSRAA